MVIRRVGAMNWMTALVLTAAMASGKGMMQAQTSSPVKDDLFAGTEKFANGASDVTEVTMDPDTLDMVGGKDAKRARNMVLNVVRTYEYPKPGMYNIADVEEIRKRLNTGDWHCSVHTRDLKSGESTDICYKRRTDGMMEQAIITVEPKELTFIHTIKRSNGQGGSLDLGSMPDLFNHLPPGALMAMMQPEFAAAQAEVAATSAAVQVQLGDLQHLNLDMPQLNTEELQNEVLLAQKGMRIWQNLPEGMVIPEIPAVPPAPSVPAAPPAPQAPPPQSAPSTPVAPQISPRVL